MENVSDKPIYHLSPVDLLIMIVSWAATQISLSITQLIGYTVKVEDVKIIVEMLQPLLAFLTTFFVFLAALVRYKHSRTQLNNDKKSKEDGDDNG